jgi:hypothetical protein
MTITLDINEAVSEQVLWMLSHFKDDLKIISHDSISMTSMEETKEINTLLDSMSDEDRKIDDSGTVELSI